MRFLFLLLAVFIVSGCNPNKVTDPNDPRFDPMEFKFDDYGQLSLKDALIRMFPEGTDQSYVEKILVEKEKSRVKRFDAGRQVTYRKWPSFFASLANYSFIVRIEYDENNKVKAIHYLNSNNILEKEISNN